MIEQCRRERRSLPPKIANAPELFVGLEWVWDAFRDLSTCRPAGFSGPMPIPWTAAAQYAEAHGIEGEMFDRLNIYVKYMDAAFLKWYDRTHGQKIKSGGISQAHGGASYRRHR